MTEQESPQRPWLRVVRGEPTADELAALMAVLATHQARASQTASSATPPRRSAWGLPASTFRQPLRQCPDAWRRSALPG